MPLPLFGGLRPFRPRGAARDALAGVTLASMNIPQVLGYTRIAETPVVTGLYTVFLPLIAFAIFGSSRHLVVAADSATAAIFSNALAPMAAPGSARYMGLVGMTALLTAGLLLLARVFRLGFLADFLARTALTGFLAGVGVQVGIAMLGGMTGIEVASRKTPVQLWEIVHGGPSLDPRLLAASLFVAGSILIGKRFAPKVPVALILVVGAIAASAWFGLPERGFPVIGPVPGGLPMLAAPAVSWNDIVAVLPVALSCFVMIIAQSAATARVYAIKNEERVDENADIMGLAAAPSSSMAVQPRPQWPRAPGRAARPPSSPSRRLWRSCSCF